MGAAKLYKPFRTLGLVCDGLTRSNCAPSIQRKGLKTYITTPVDDGRSLHTYDNRLQLKAASPPVPEGWNLRAEDGSRRISGIVQRFNLTLVALGADIAVFVRLRPYTLWKGHESAVTGMLITGAYLVTVSSEEHRILAWSLPEKAKDPPSISPAIVSDVILPLDFSVTSMIHPPTYMNKVLLGARDGRCILINLKTKSIIYTFSPFGSPITTLSCTPVIDVVAVGTADGRVILHNFRFDETIVTYEHDEIEENEDEEIVREASGVSCISFRTDGKEHMVTAGKSGSIILWDLNEKRVLSKALKVHTGGVAVASFLQGEPILVTAGRRDNSLKIHIFDGVEGEARLLRSREGHRLPPTCVRFCGRTSRMMVSTGLDREIRVVSAVNDSQNRTFSQAGLSKASAKTKKRKRARKGVEVGAQDSSITGLLPPVVDISTNNARLRDKDFANVMTAHVNRDEVYTWRLQSNSVFQHVLKAPARPVQLRLKHGPPSDTPVEEKPVNSKQDTSSKHRSVRSATCVVMTPCGNFGIVGSADGRVHCYNLQSGNHIGAYEEASDGATGDSSSIIAPEWGYAHNGPLASLAVDALGDILLTSGAADRKIKYWKLRTRKREPYEINTESQLVSIVWCKCSDLLAVACEDFNVYIYDGSSQKLARSFIGHRGPISDMCFDTEGRRLVTSSMDGTIRTWDLLSGVSIDVLRCADSPTSVAVAPGGDFIASTHVNNLGVILWVDRSKFTPVTNTSGKTPHEKVLELANLNSSDSECSTFDSESESESEEEPGDHVSFVERKGPLGPEMATFSDKPLTHWTMLGNLSAIKERNKPLAAPKKPEQVPFFLPTMKGTKFQFDMNQIDDATGKESKELNSGNEAQDAKNSADMDVSSDSDFGNSEFGKLVNNGDDDGATRLLLSLNSSGVDLELRTLEGQKTLINAAEYFLRQVQKSDCYELTQAHLGVFLNAYGNELAQMEESESVLSALLQAQESAWLNLRQQFDAVVALSGHFSGLV